MRLGFLAAIILGTTSTAHAASKPNVLFLLADDMRADSIAALGNPAIKTPHLDALARRGFSFRNVYCLGGNSPAVCTPSRNMLLSGNAYFRWKDFKPPKGGVGAVSPGTGPNLPLSFQAAGYATYHYGKRGNTAPLIEAKFAVNKYLRDDQAERLSGEPGREIVDAAIEHLQARDRQRPFCMYLAFANPHDPRAAAERYQQIYAGTTPPLPKNFLPQHPFDNGEMAIRDEALLPWPRPEPAMRETIRIYNATVTGLDFHIGRLLAALQELGELDNTVIVFSADQGIALGSHGLLGKQSLYDAAMKSPLVLAGPGIRHGASEALVYLLDIYPTLCELAGFAPPAGIDGRSFKPVIDGRQDAARAELFLSYRGVQRAIRDGRWKLIRYPDVDVTQLFDLSSDPDEMHDLAGDPAQQPRIGELLARLKRQQAAYGDDLPLTVAKPKPRTSAPP